MGAGGLPMNKITVLVLLSLATFWAIPADAQEMPAGGMTANEVASFLQGEGLAASVVTNTQGRVAGDNDNMVKSSVPGANFSVVLLDCTADRCETLQYRAGCADCSRTPDQANAWNLHRRWIKAVIQDTACFGQFDIIVARGVSHAYLVQTLSNWKDTIGNFVQWVGSGTLD
jgi:hypothetical protein